MVASTSTVFHSAFSLVVTEVGRAQEPVGDVRTLPLAQRDEERQVGRALHVLVEPRHGALDVELLNTTCAIAIASAPSVPAAAGSQWSANFVCPAKSGDTTTTFCPR